MHSEGYVEGIEKWRLAEREEVAKHLLRQGLNIVIIENATRLSRKDLARVFIKDFRSCHHI